MAQTKVVMKLEGFEKVQRAFTAMPQAAKERVSGAISRSTFALTRRVQAGAPVATGRLRNSIHAKLPARAGLTGRVLVGNSEFYWRFIEYGTVKMAARPFIRPSAETETPEFIKAVRDSVNDLVHRFPGRLT